MIMLFCSCQKKSDGYKYVIGVSQSNLVEPAQIALYEEILAEGNKYSDLKLIFSDSSGESKRQESEINRLMELGIDLLIVSPADSKSLTPAINEVYKKIPVIVMDRNIESDNYTLFIGANNKKIGTMAGDFIVDILGEKGGNVLELMGNVSSVPTQDISMGLDEVLKNNPNINLMGKVDANWLRDPAEMIMKSFLMRNQKVDIVFAHNDAMAYGAYLAAQQYRVYGIKFIGVGGLEEEGVKMVESEIFAGTFFREIGGKSAVDYAIKILDGESEIPKQIILEPEIIKAN